ncbi:MAG: GGDEF domain-containing protein [Candidatus Omnitrophica bacterium]|nr:GGDEF domain-containing protein [Candidatus Omnitrophota bacterium]
MKFTQQRLSQVLDRNQQRIAAEKKILGVLAILNLLGLAFSVSVIFFYVPSLPELFSPPAHAAIAVFMCMFAANLLLIWMIIRSRRAWTDAAKNIECDKLTGALHWRSFLEVLDEEVRRAGRYRYPLSLCLLDLDDFQSANNNFGTTHGDEILQRFSKFMMGTVRFTDTFARYDRDEFLVLLPHTDIVRAQKFASRTLMQSIERIDSSFSAGLTLFQVGEKKEQFLERAALALKQAKREGKKRIQCVIAEGGMQTALSL